MSFQKGILSALLLFFIAGTVSAEFKEFLSEDAKYERFLKDPTFEVNSPFIQEDSIIFYYRGKARSVRIAGDFNGWKTDLAMQQHTNDVWIFKWNKRLKAGQYKYKLIIDDIWIEDIYNTNSVLDSSGQKISFFDIESPFIPSKQFPLHVEDDKWMFRYTDVGVNHITLVGDFNHWNPYSTEMKHKGGGVFEVTVRLKPGIHVYGFVIDGEWKADPNNLTQYSDQTGKVVNVIKVPGKLKPY